MCLGEDMVNISQHTIPKLYTSIRNTILSSKVKCDTLDHYLQREIDVGGITSPSYNELIADLVLKGLQERESDESSKEKKESLSKFEKILKSQTAQLSGLEKSSNENQLAGEMIYKHYADLEKLLAYINEQREKRSWKALKEELKAHKHIKRIDEHNGTVQLELE